MRQAKEIHDTAVCLAEVAGTLSKQHLHSEHGALYALVYAIAGLMTNVTARLAEDDVHPRSEVMQ